MTSQAKYDEHVLIREQREETGRILKAASEKGKKPIRKLDTLDARFIVREKRRGTSSRAIAGILKVCTRQVQRIWSRFRRLGTGSILYLPRRPGRHRKGEPGRREHSAVLAAFGRVVNGASAICRHIRDAGGHVPKDDVHRVLLENGPAREERAKKRRRRYVRYGRRHSSTLWHADYTQLEDGRWMIVYVDDSSRYVVGHGVFDRATSENATAVFRRACLAHGTPYSVLTDHGSQFYAMESGARRERGRTRFEAHLRDMGVRQILARVGHPQTNGKAERVFKECKYKIGHFADVAGPPGTAAPFGAPAAMESDPAARFVRNHNNKPHGSLYGQTPADAYRERRLPEGRSYKDDDGQDTSVNPAVGPSSVCCARSRKSVPFAAV